MLKSVETLLVYLMQRGKMSSPFPHLLSNTLWSCCLPHPHTVLWRCPGSASLLFGPVRVVHAPSLAPTPSLHQTQILASVLLKPRFILLHRVEAVWTIFDIDRKRGSQSSGGIDYLVRWEFHGTSNYMNADMHRSKTPTPCKGSSRRRKKSRASHLLGSDMWCPPHTEPWQALPTVSPILTAQKHLLHSLAIKCLLNSQWFSIQRKQLVTLHMTTAIT